LQMDKVFYTLRETVSQILLRNAIRYVCDRKVMQAVVSL
jgi:hypothetical protein